MTDTVWAAAIAVFGTALGASIAPIFAALREGAAVKSEWESGKLKAAADCGEPMMKYASMAPDLYSGSGVVSARSTAIGSRFYLARYLLKGSGQVDRFVEYSLALISEHSRAEPREAIASYAASRLLDWARGDLPAEQLKKFDVQQTNLAWMVI